ncbi:MAG: hypothetical protein GWN29_01025, partial [Gammaproteobacteria bacterium]|nr:hypothetical protein [Gammaproteobacteria bacterium]
MGIPVFVIGLLLGLSVDPLTLLVGGFAALPLAVVRIAGERRWSLLPQAAIAASLIAPDEVTTVTFIAI